MGIGRKRAKGTTKSFEEQFGTDYFSESFDRPAASYLLQNAKEIGLPPSEIDALGRLLRKAKNGNVLQVWYDKGAKDIDRTGRWFAKGMMSLQRLPKQVRATLCKELYIDLDFVNCGPTLLLNLCQKHGLECTCLSKVVEDRDNMLKEFEPCLTRDEAKKVIIELIHGKSLKEIRADNPTNPCNLDGVDWLPTLETELELIRKDLAACDDYEEIRSQHKNAGNRNVKIMSAVLFTEENECLQHFCNFLGAKGVIQNGECVLCFDGIMVRKTPENEALINDSGPEFLEAASEDIKKRRRHTTPLRIKVKDFSDGYELPEDYATTAAESFFVIESGNDQAAADIIVKAAGDCIKKSQGRLFGRPKNSIIYEEGEKGVKSTILNMTADGCLTIMVESQNEKNGQVEHYSKNTAKLNGCISRVLADPGIVDEGFKERLWQGNLKHIAYKNGVYSFVECRLLSIEDAQQRHIFFTHDTGRLFPRSEGSTNMETDASDTGKRSDDDIDDASQELFRRVIEPFLPDTEQRTFFLNCIARALAGEIPDKRWYACLGARNSGKGIFCRLLKLAFGPFVRTMQAENLLSKVSSQDAAKAQSWMQDHEYTRIAFSNEMSGTGTRKLDGEMVKRLCSNGDVIEVRQNYKDEIQIRLQMTMFLFANDIPSIDPVDAYQTMTGFKLMSEFHEQKDFHDPPSAIQKNWRPMDESLEAFIQRPDVQNAFALLILKSYTPGKLPLPDIVKEHTASIKGDAAESQEERFARIVEKTGDKSDVVFYKEIRQTAIDAGMGHLSDTKIDGYVSKLYSLESNKPSKMVDGMKKQDRGFTHLRVCYNGHDERAERLKRNEEVKQGVRTHDRFTSDAKPPTL